MKTNDLQDDLQDERVSQLLSWCLEWLKLPQHFAAQNTEALADSAILLDVLAHTFPVIATQEFRSPFIREIPSEWQIIITADQFSPQGLVLGDVRTRLVPQKPSTSAHPSNRFGFECKPSRILTAVSSCKSICGSSCFKVREMPRIPPIRSRVWVLSRTRSRASRISRVRTFRADRYRCQQTC